MEVYTPIPESALRRPPRWLRSSATLVLTAVAVFGAWKVADFTFSEPIANKYMRFGVVETRFGPALAKCGGESGLRCGDGTTLVFASCADDVEHYFWGEAGADQDALARALIGKRPPTGDKWEFGGCWWSGWGAFPTGPPAELQSI